MKTIFIIDDEEGICDLLKSVFLREGYSVFTANSCDEALVMLDNISPDLILLDIAMPEISGIELCQKIKNTLSFEDVPVLIMSGYDNEERKAASYMAGANDYILKPFVMEELISKVKNELEPLKIGIK